MKKHWMQQAFAHHKGALHRDLGIPVGQKIPVATLEKAGNSGGHLGRRARAALNARRS